MSTKSSIASEHPLASLAGYEVLRSGGNAFDAAAAVGFALSVLLPQLSGLGGDFFALFEDGKSGKIHCINGSGRTPSGFTIEGMRSLGSTGMPAHGPNSAIVPGFVAGVCEMQEMFGVLERSKVLEGAISLAKRGFPVSRSLSRAISDSQEDISPAAKKAFTNRGRALDAGSILKQPRLAKRLQEISDAGPDGFYSGEAAEEIRAAMTTGGLEVNASDISSYKPEWTEPLGITFRDHEVLEIPPNSMGATTLLILKQLEKFDPRDVKPNSQKRIRRMVEAAKLAYSARDEQIADPSFVSFDLDKFLKGPRRKRTLRNLAKGDTTYFAISDEEGNLLSCIQSLFHRFGSRVFLDGSGFFLNNRGSAFEFDGPNALAPLKRPIHTLSALLIRKGSSAVAIGCSGGEYRPQQHALLVTNMLDYAMDIEEAIDFPRFLWNGNDALTVEKGYKIAENPKYRLQVLDYPGATGVAQGVQVSSESKRAVSDIRGDGLPIGN